MTSTRDSHALLVAGAVSYDYLVYPEMTVSDQAPKAVPEEGSDASQLVIRTGAADLVAQLLTAAAPQWGFEVLGPVLANGGSSIVKSNASSVVDLELAEPNEINRGLSLRVVRERKIAKSPVWHSPAVDQASAAKASTVIISGSGEALKDVEPALTSCNAFGLDTLSIT